MKANYAGRCVRCQQPFWRGDTVDAIPPPPGGDWTYAHAPTCPEPNPDPVAAEAPRTTCPCGNPTDRGLHHCHGCRAINAAGRVADCSACGNTYARIPTDATQSPCCGATWRQPPAPLIDHDPAPFEVERPDEQAPTERAA